MNSQYNETFITALQWLWGDGNLAPGGTDDLSEMLDGIDTQAMDILDVGCGLGAIAVDLVQNRGAASVVGDWLRGGEGPCSDNATRWLEIVHLDFEMQNLQQTSMALQQSGFAQVRLNDRNAWYKEEIKSELATLEGDKYQRLAELIGNEAAEHRLQSSRLKQQVVEEGFLRPTHFVAIKPA